MNKINLLICLVSCNLTWSYVIANSQLTNGTTAAAAAAAVASNLPTLTERANGLNSRYLSAGSTASLAAATVAAAAGGGNPQSGPLQVNQQHNQQLNQQQHHQQQQQQSQNQPISANQQQQQQVSSGHHAGVTSSTTSSANQVVSQLPAAQQYTNPTIASQVAPPPTQSISPPVMTSTYAFNPLTGQYGPADTGNSNNWIQQLLAQQQQQQQFNNNNNFNNYVRQRQPLAPPLGQAFYQVPPYGNAGGIFRTPQQLTFSRRGGAGPLQQVGGTQLRPSYQQLTGSADEDINQQQQVNGGPGYPNSLADQLAVSLGFQFQDSLNNNQQQQQLDQFGSSGSGTGNGNSGYNNGFSNSQAAGQLQLPSNVVAQQVALPVGGADHAQQHNQCVAADGRHGTCYQASECIRRGGTPMGRCGSSSQILTGSGSQFSSELSGSSHVCCLFDVTCGNQFAAERFVYFRNPNFPNTYDQSRMCRAKIGKLDKGVCQFRVDLLKFDIAKPTNGNCSQDMFVVSGQNENYIIPKICGLNDGQHYYVGVDESGVITLHMMMMGFYRRNFEVLVTQIPCRSDFAAPAHCLQHYLGTHGTIKSFNYDDDQQQIQMAQSQAQNSFVNYDLQPDGSSVPHVAPYGLQFAGTVTGSNQQLQQRQAVVNRYQQQQQQQQQQFDYTFGGYPNDLDYTICIRKESGFCSITYQLSRADSGQLSPFAVGVANPGTINIYGNNTNGGGGGDTLLSATTTNSVSTECRDDYLLIGGVRLCSGNGGGAGQFTGTGGQFYEQQNNNNNSSYVIQQQLLNQRDLLMQQLARLQQQQVGSGNPSTGNNNNQQQQLTGSGGQLDQQQQAAIVQQLMITQQQLTALATTASQQQQQFNGGQFQGNSQDLQGAIITDTTSGPFLLRFVSNVARNARGFHIDYRQNPCK